MGSYYWLIINIVSDYLTPYPTNRHFIFVTSLTRSTFLPLLLSLHELLKKHYKNKFITKLRNKIILENFVVQLKVNQRHHFRHWFSVKDKSDQLSASRTSSFALHLICWKACLSILRLRPENNHRPQLKFLTFSSVCLLSLCLTVNYFLYKIVYHVNDPLSCKWK